MAPFKPGRNPTTPSREEALRRLDKARQVRAAWAELQRRIRAGEVKPRDVLDRPERYGAERLRVTTFLCYCPGIREPARDIFLHRARVLRTRRLRSLTPRQRRALAELIENPNLSHAPLRPNQPKPKPEAPSRPSVEQVRAELTEAALDHGFESLQHLRTASRVRSGRARNVFVVAIFEARERGATLDTITNVALSRDNRRTYIKRLIEEGRVLVEGKREILREAAEQEPGVMPELTTPRRMQPRPRRGRSAFADRR